MWRLGESLLPIFGFITGLLSPLGWCRHLLFSWSNSWWASIWGYCQKEQTWGVSRVFPKKDWGAGGGVNSNHGSMMQPYELQGLENFCIVEGVCIPRRNRCSPWVHLPAVGAWVLSFATSGYILVKCFLRSVSRYSEWQMTRREN